MKLLAIISILFLASCNQKQIKHVEIVDHDFKYIDVTKGVVLPHDDILDLRVKVSQANVFDNRLEQIQWVLDVTEYALNLDLSVVDFKSMPPTPYLSFNKLITVKHYLRLAGFHGQQIVIDSVNKQIIYLNDVHPLFLDATYFSKLYGMAGENESDKEITIHEPVNNLVHNVSDEITGNLKAEDVSQINAVAVNNDVITIDVQDLPLSSSDETEESADVENKLDISIEALPVIEQPKVVKFSATSGVSLRQLFTDLGQFNHLDFVSSLGRYDWFLNSTINHDYSFDDLDHALILLLSECNDLIVKNSLGFVLKATTANGILDLYYE